MANKKFIFLICALFTTLLLIGAVSASEDTNDNITAVSDDSIVVDEVVSEVESNDDSISVNADEQKGDVDDSASTLKANQENISVEDESAPTLGNNNDDVVLSDANDGMNHVYVSPDGTGDGSSYESPTSIANAITANIASNTVIHLADGGYSLTKAVTIQKKDNLIIQAENPKNATITSTVALTFTGCKNILIKGITFITSKQLIATRAASGVNTENFTIDDCSFEIGDKSAIILNMNVGANLNINNCYFTASLTSQYPININPAVPANINIYNCTFENITMAGLTAGVIYFTPSSSFTGSFCIDSCKFYNINSGSTNNKGIIYIGLMTANNPYIIIKNNIFQNNISIPCIFTQDPSNTNYNMEISFENNTINTPYAIRLGKTTNLIDSIEAIISNNNESVVNDTTEITAVVMDDMGNRINHVNLKFIINETEYTPTFDSATGMYVLDYIPENVGSVEITVECDKMRYMDVEPTILNVKASPELSLNFTNIAYGDEFKVNATLKDDVRGENITLTVINSTGDIIKSIVVKINNAKANASFENLDSGDYTIVASYDGDEIYGSSTVTNTFTVTKVNSTIELITDPTVPVWDSINVQAIVPVTATGNVTFRLNNETIIVEINNGVAEAIFDGLTEGSYTIYAVYDGDNNYNPSEEVNTTIDVTKVDSALDLTYTDPIAGEDVIITIAMNDDINDNVTITVNDNSEVISLTNGSATYTIPSVSAGEIYTVQVDYNGSEKYNPVADSITFAVQKANTTVDLSVGDITVGEDVELTIALADDINDNVTVFVDGVSESVKLADGSAVYTIKAVTAGIHNVLVNFEGNDKYSRAYGYLAFNVEKLNTTLEATSNPISGGEDAVITVAVDPEATGFVLINSTYYAAISGGSATVTIPNLANGTYTYTVVYSGDEKYNRKETAVTVTVIKLKTSISCEPVITVYGSDDYLVAKLTDENGKAIIGAIVTVELNGSKTYTSDGNGTVKVPLKDLAPNTYDAVIAFAGNESHAASNATAKVIITQSSVVLNASYTVSVLDDGFTVNIIVNTNPSINGNLTIKFNGGEYPVEVVNGTANFTSDKVYANTYATDIIYPGSGEYENSSATVNALVKPTSVTQLNTFNYYYYNNDMGSDSEKGISQIKVVDSDGNPIKKGLVTITIMNKYKLKVRTDANGVAKFTKAYKPGTYSVTAEHNNKTTKLGNLVLKSVVNLPKVSKVSKSAKSTTIKITLKGTSPLKGKTVVVNLMKVNYKVKTDNNGVALFKVTKDMVSKLAVGKTYKIRATYRMDSVAQSIKILK